MNSAPREIPIEVRYRYRAVVQAIEKAGGSADAKYLGLSTLLGTDVAAEVLAELEAGGVVVRRRKHAKGKHAKQKKSALPCYELVKDMQSYSP